MGRSPALPPTNKNKKQKTKKPACRWHVDVCVLIRNYRSYWKFKHHDWNLGFTCIFSFQKKIHKHSLQRGVLCCWETTSLFSMTESFIEPDFTYGINQHNSTDFRWTKLIYASWELATIMNTDARGTQKSQAYVQIFPYYVTKLKR